jgi:hypothetical protein
VFVTATVVGGAAALAGDESPTTRVTYAGRGVADGDVVGARLGEMLVDGVSDQLRVTLVVALIETDCDGVTLTLGEVDVVALTVTEADVVALTVTEADVVKLALGVAVDDGAMQHAGSSKLQSWSRRPFGESWTQF